MLRSRQFTAMPYEKTQLLVIVQYQLIIAYIISVCCKSVLRFDKPNQLSSLLYYHKQPLQNNQSFETDSKKKSNKICHKVQIYTNNLILRFNSARNNSTLSAKIYIVITRLLTLLYYLCLALIEDFVVHNQINTIIYSIHHIPLMFVCFQ